MHQAMAAGARMAARARRPRMAPALSPFNNADTLTDDALVAILVRVPFLAHGALRAVCRRVRALLASETFRAARVASRRDETALVCLGRGLPRFGATRDPVCEKRAWIERDGAWHASARTKSIARWNRAITTQPAAMVWGDALAIVEPASSARVASSQYQPLETVSDEVTLYRPRNDAFEALPPAPVARFGAACGVVAGALMVAGGRTRARRVRSVDVYRRGTWHRSKPMPFTALESAACVVNDKLYVAGGAPPDATRLQMWDGGRWSRLADLPAPRVRACAVAFDGKVMIIGGARGGLHGGRIVHHLIVYDPATDRWTREGEIPQVPGRHVFSHACAYDGAVIAFVHRVIGGVKRVTDDFARRPYRFTDGVWTDMLADGVWAEMPARLPDPVGLVAPVSLG